MMKVKGFLPPILVLASMPSLFAAWVSPVVSSGEVRVGEWNSNFEASKAYAECYHLPYIVYFGETGCDYCEAMSASLAKDSYFLTWQTKRPVVLCYKHPGYWTSDDRLADKFVFGYRPDGTWEQGAKPGMAFYLMDTSGTSEVLRFAGRNGQMPIGDTGDSLAKQLADSADLYFQDSFFPGDGLFKVGNLPAARLEIQQGFTTYVDVPVTRTNSFNIAMSNEVVATYGDSYSVSAWASWAVGDETVYVRIPTPDGIANDEEVRLLLFNALGEQVDESAITCVEAPKNNPKNPLWVGRKTASGLAWGEWTMDYDIARQKVAGTSGAAYTLVLVGGSLWCPDCVKTDHYLIDTDEFRNWAVSNRVACVAIDVPRMNSTDPSLLTYGTDAVSKRYINCTEPPQEPYQSGAGYLSRNMIATAEAAAVAARNRAFLYNDTQHGGLCRPENVVTNNPETGEFKTGIPCLILMRKDGTVAGRIYQFNNESPDKFDAGYIRRLDELLGQVADPLEEDNDHFSTTKAVLKPEVDATATFSPTDARDVWLLEACDGRAIVTLSGPGPASNVTLRLSQKSGDELVDLATASGPLEKGLAVTSAFAGGEVYVTVEAGTSFHPYPKSYLPLDDECLVRGYTLSSVVTIIPSESTARHVFDASVTTAAVEVVFGKSYWIEGLGELAGTEGLAKVSENVYRATVDGAVRVPLAETAEDSRTVNCRTWTGGEIGFAETSREVSEGKAGLVAFGLERTSGESGFVTGRVTLRHDAAVDKALADGRIVWQDADFRWENGQSSPTNLILAVIDDTIHDENLNLVFDVAVTDSEIPGVGVRTGYETFTLRLLEDDPESPGELTIAVARPAFATERTIKAEVGSTVSVGVRRTGGATGTVTGYLVLKNGESTLATSAVMTWQDRSRTTLQWASFPVPAFPAGQSLTIQFVATGAAPVAADGARAALQVLSAEGPAFAEDSVTKLGSRGFAFERAVVVNRTAGFDSITVRKTSGSLPTGLVTDYTNGVFTVSGAPSVAGSYTVAYQTYGQKGTVTIPGTTLRFVFEITDVTAALKEEFPSLATARTYKNVPVSDGSHLTGLLTVTVPSSGRVSARYRTPNGSWSYSAEGWSSYEVGVSVGATLDSVRSDEPLSLVVRTDGTAAVTFADPETGDPVSAELPADEWSATSTASAWEGRYTVQMPQTNAVVATETTPRHATGAAFLTLRMTSSAARSGTMTYAGLLPNGLTLSGSATLVPQPDGRARLPFLSSSKASQSAYSLTGAFDIRPNAALEHTEYRWSVKAAEGAVPRWVMADVLGGAAEFAVFGGYYDKNEISRCFTNDYGTAGGGFEPFGFTANTDGSFKISPKYGAVGMFAFTDAFVTNNVPHLVDPENPDQVTLSFNADTGVLTGKLSMPLTTARPTAQWRGVVLPGWGDCASCEQPGSVAERPFMSGACWFSDRCGNQTFRNGCEVTMDRLTDE